VFKSSDRLDSSCETGRRLWQWLAVTGCRLVNRVQRVERKRANAAVRNPFGSSHTVQEPRASTRSIFTYSSTPTTVFQPVCIISSNSGDTRKETNANWYRVGQGVRPVAHVSGPACSSIQCGLDLAVSSYSNIHRWPMGRSVCKVVGGWTLDRQARRAPARQ